MQKNIYIIFCLILLSSCAINNQYTFQQTSILQLPKKKPSICIKFEGNTIATTQTVSFLQKYLDYNGFEVVDAPICEYTASFMYDTKVWQTQKTVPIFGQTGISSIQTNTFGNLNGFSNTSYYGNNAYTNLYGNYSQNSYSTVNYNYGITGYQNVIDTQSLQLFTLAINDKKNLTVVETKILVNAMYDNNLFANNVMNILLQNYQINNYNKEYNCENGCTLLLDNNRATEASKPVISLGNYTLWGK